MRSHQSLNLRSKLISDEFGIAHVQFESGYIMTDDLPSDNKWGTNEEVGKSADMRQGIFYRSHS
jgi:hypothetical protein